MYGGSASSRWGENVMASRRSKAPAPGVSLRDTLIGADDDQKIFVFLQIFGDEGRHIVHALDLRFVDGQIAFE